MGSSQPGALGLRCTERSQGGGADLTLEVGASDSESGEEAEEGNREGVGC